MGKSSVAIKTKATQQQTSLEAELQATLNVIPAYTWYAAPSGPLMFVNQRTAGHLGLFRKTILSVSESTLAGSGRNLSFQLADRSSGANTPRLRCFSSVLMRAASRRHSHPFYWIPCIAFLGD
jgi:hypothetical protein